MHTFKASDGTVIIYNPDLSDVRIVVPTDCIENVSDNNAVSTVSHVQVSGPALREFIVSNIRDGIVLELENFNIARLFQ